MKPIRCLLFGHIIDENQSPYDTVICTRCGESEVGPDEQSIWGYRDWYGIVGTPYYLLRKQISRVRFPCCWECKRLIFFRPVEDHFCSQKCADIWIPF